MLAKYVKYREEKFGGVLFETLKERVFSLNPTASEVVKGLAAGKAVEEIVSGLREDYDDPDGALDVDVREFAESLKADGLVNDQAGAPAKRVGTEMVEARQGGNHA